MNSLENSMNTPNLFNPGRDGDRARDREGVMATVRAETKVGKAEKLLGMTGRFGEVTRDTGGRKFGKWKCMRRKRMQGCGLYAMRVGGGDDGQGREDRDSRDGEGDGGKMVETSKRCQNLHKFTGIHVHPETSLEVALGVGETGTKVDKIDDYKYKYEYERDGGHK
ncbi:hypothetical protein K435DRAFT_804003 [Dendrothele bispora CBS 962.96]|uniref:Uncharacterized protein n=1 Tax=Dendrothele bispora (strain CBS 962.96) TaxID=1314807 RepID=A0A4S8LGF0_DENBC|nr:hypothetical protein K435DRAFT_804003 [Dendrothele bispora CBS 962.96]